MKAKLLAGLNDCESTKYKQSELYQKYVLANYQYTDTCIDYYTDYFNYEHKNFSIVVFDETETPVQVLYAFATLSVFSYFEQPVSIVEVLFNNSIDKNKSYRALLNKLNEVLVFNSFHRIKFYNNDYLCAEFYSKIVSSEPEYNCQIDLSLSEEVIKGNIRKSYKSLVNWGEKNISLSLIDKNNADNEKFLEFRDFHIFISGRKTRSDKSWDLQFESIKKNEAYLLLGYLSNKLVSGSLILHGKTKAYYGVGVYDRKLMDENIAVSHSNILSSIYHAKKIGLETINLGFIGAFSEENKEKNIFKFKSGFTPTINTSIKLDCNI